MAINARAQKAVGSSAWIAKEKENMMELVNQEIEEVEYPVRHEMDWLNEHMDEIFSKGQAHFTDVFKTPGKMRGKTPRTARKRNVEESRVPLSEIFSSAQKPVDIFSSTQKSAHVDEKSPRPVEETKESAMSTTPATQPHHTPKKEDVTHLQEFQADMHLDDTAKRYSILDNFDDIGSPSDNSTPERPLVRKSSLSFASLPAREPLVKSVIGSRLSRTSHIDLPKLSNGSRASYLRSVTQPPTDEMDIDGEKPAEVSDVEKASKRHNTNSTQSLHERISMLGKQQPARPRKSIPTIANLSSGGHITYPELPSSNNETAVKPERPKSAASLFASPRPKGHQASASTSHIPSLTTTPTGSPRRFEGPLSASKLRLQSIMKTAQGLFRNTGSPVRFESSSPEQSRHMPQKTKVNADSTNNDSLESRPYSPTRQEARRTRSSTEKEEKRLQKEVDDRHQEETHQEGESEQENQRLQQLKATLDKSSIEPEERAVTVAQKPTHIRQPSREPEYQGSKLVLPQTKHNDRRPKPTRELQQKQQPQPVSIRVGSTLPPRQIPMPSSMSSSVQESSLIGLPAPKAPTLKKKGSNNSLYASSNNLKSSVSSQTQVQRKTQLAHERKKEQEEREARRREEQKRELERKRAAAQQQEEARREEMRSRAEAERERRERSAQEDPKKVAHMQAIEKRRLENARKRAVMDDDAGPSSVHMAEDPKRRKTEDEHNTRQAVRPVIKAPLRKPSIRNPSLFGQSSVSGSSIFKSSGGQPQRPPHPIDISKYAHGKIPFSELSHAPPPAAHKPTPGSAQRAPPPAKPSPQYQNGDSIHLPEIATDSEDEDDSDTEMFPVPKWAQPKELEGLLRQQDGMEVDSIFGPIAPFSLEETFKADKKVKKYRDRTSSANWSGPDGLTQEEIHKDRAGRQRLRMNGGWSFNNT